MLLLQFDADQATHHAVPCMLLQATAYARARVSSYTAVVMTLGIIYRMICGRIDCSAQIEAQVRQARGLLPTRRKDPYSETAAQEEVHPISITGSGTAHRRRWPRDWSCSRLQYRGARQWPVNFLPSPVRSARKRVRACLEDHGSIRELARSGRERGSDAPRACEAYHRFSAPG